MSYKYFLLLFLTAFFAKNGNSQNKSDKIISLQECIDYGLENNPAIKIDRNKEQISNHNKSLQPFMPVIRGTGRQNFSQTESNLTYASGGDREFKNVKSESVNAGLNFSWRLFDGFGMFSTYKKSKITHSLSVIQTRRTIENIVVNISNSYYNIIVQQRRVDAATKTLELSKERYRINEEKLNIGSVSGMDLQQAKLDFNSDSSYLVRQKELLMSSYIRLNRFMNADLNLNSYISDTIVLGKPLLLNDLQEATINNNSSLLAASLGIVQSRAELKQVRAARYPAIDFVSGYTYNKAESPASVLTFNESKGINYGFEASVGIFNGFQLNRNIKNSIINVENKELEYEETRLVVMAELHTLYNTYLNNLMMVEFEKQNVMVSQNNLELALERYDLGALSGLGFREFQLSYLNAVDRSLTALYQAKVIELSLLVISGQMEEFIVRINGNGVN